MNQLVDPPDPVTLCVCDVVQEEAAKSVLADFNLGCDVEHTQHVYRVYVTTFLGFGGNMARQRYEDWLLNSTVTKNRYEVGGELVAVSHY